MGWGCYKHKWDAGSDAWRRYLDSLCAEQMGQKPRTWGRDGQICPACYAELRTQRDELLAACNELLAVVRVQNGNLHAETNDIQRRAVAAIAKCEPKSGGGA